jgi:hypothetical protein
MKVTTLLTSKVEQSQVDMSTTASGVSMHPTAEKSYAPLKAKEKPFGPARSHCDTPQDVQQ